MRTVEYSLCEAALCTSGVQLEHNSAVGSAAAAAAGGCRREIGAVENIGRGEHVSDPENSRNCIFNNKQASTLRQHVSSLHNRWYWFCGDLGGGTNVGVSGGEG